MFQTRSRRISETALQTYRQIGLLLITYKTSHKSFRMRQKSLTLDDLKGQYALLWLNGTLYYGNNER